MNTSFGFSLDIDDATLVRESALALGAPVRERLRLVWPGPAAMAGRLQWGWKAGSKQLDLLRWGWRKRVWDARQEQWLWRSLRHARIEGLRRSDTWQAAWQANRRCLIPVSSWWEDRPSGRVDLPLAARGTISWLAGLWLPGERYDHVLPLTAAPRKAWRGHLSRVPVVVPPASAAFWFDPQLSLQSGIHHARVWQPEPELLDAEALSVAPAA